jgi:hypothetical protein
MEKKYKPPKLKKKKGGAIFGAGRKPKYSEPCIKVNFKIPISKEQEIRKMIERICEPLLYNAKND